MAARRVEVLPRLHEAEGTSSCDFAGSGAAVSVLIYVLFLDFSATEVGLAQATFPHTRPCE